VANVPEFFRLSSVSQDSLVGYAQAILADHDNFTELRAKMEQIDISYARYKIALQQNTNGVDVRAGSDQVGAIGIDNIVVPVVISQVDSFVGYLADVFLTGTPIFPVVSSPNNIKEAETLESIIQNHSILGGYARQLLLGFRHGIKYNFMPVATEWVPINNYSINSSVLRPLDKAKAEKTTSYYNKVTAWDPYNTVWDRRYAPADVAVCGDFIGHISVISRTELKRKLNSYSTQGNGYNIGTAFKFDTTDALANTMDYYYDKPQISNFVSAPSMKNLGYTNWDQWLSSTTRQKNEYKNCYEYFCLYARIIPSEHNMTNVPEQNSPQIWKLEFINGRKLIHASRIISAFDMLPVQIAQPLEDGFSYQTQSVAEGEIPFQDSASTLFNIRLSSARRAISDRALYNPTLINPAHINAPHASPKIPVQVDASFGLDAIEKAYKQIPFDDSGTANSIGDAQRVMELSSMLHGANRPQQGQFQKGNKSVTEWNDTMAASNNRLRLPALCLEFQLFVPMRENIKMNIFQYGAQGVYQNYKTGESIDVTTEQLDKLREAVLGFFLGDGYTPKSKIASTDFLATGMQMLSQSQVLQQQLGPLLPKMFVHLMSLGGVKNLDQYVPQQQSQQQTVQQPIGAQPSGPGAAQQPQPTNTQTPTS
jgi:hypothetical protein